MGDPESTQVQNNSVEIMNCPFCDKKYKHHRTLKAHVRKSHPDRFQEFPKKTYKFKCSNCNRCYNKSSHLTHHNKVAHGIQPQRPKTYKCPLCKEIFSKADILRHFEEAYDFKMNETTLEFSSFEDFQKWREDMEKVTESKFVLKRAAMTCSRYSIRNFICQCSGEFRSHGKGIRRPKVLGSRKIGGYCPAGIRTTEFKDGKCTVVFQDTHVGHEKGFGLTKKELIAAKKILTRKRRSKKTELSENKPTKVASPKLSMGSSKKETKQIKVKLIKVASPKLCIEAFQNEATKHINETFTKVAPSKFYVDSFQNVTTKRVNDKIIILASPKLSIDSFKKEVEKKFNDILNFATTQEEVEIIERQVMSAKAAILAMRKKAFFDNFQREINYSS